LVLDKDWEFAESFIKGDGGDTYDRLEAAPANSLAKKVYDEFVRIHGATYDEANKENFKPVMIKYEGYYYVLRREGDKKIKLWRYPNVSKS
jgi:hypothetical protein